MMSCLILCIYSLKRDVCLRWSTGLLFIWNWLAVCCCFCQLFWCFSHVIPLMVTYKKVNLAFLTSWQPTAAADGCVSNILKSIHMLEYVMEASADVFLATRQRGMCWQLFIFEITSGISSFQPLPVPPAVGGAQSDVVIESDSSSGSDMNWELWPLNWDSSRFKEQPEERTGSSSIKSPAK